MKVEDAKILIIDDDAVLGRLLGRRLERLGYKNMEICAGVEAAIQVLARRIPDVILTDIHMKPINGIEFVQRLRAHPKPSLQQIPVIFVTGDSSLETMKAAAQLGSAGLVLKPPRIETLKAKLEQALKLDAQDFESW